MASSTGVPEHNHAHAETEPLLGRPGDVTQKPSEGLQWNFVTGTAMIAQAGIWILAALVWSAVFEASFSFFSYHPVRVLLQAPHCPVLKQGIRDKRQD